ncbi:hypothetical protein NHP190012_03940 [Helicobacter sp. NHP19-012]|uniref:Uncharacterized protein n=1 Tax=Helicobacter gastrofelis TaxID=2849642 RepID=A0ABM7SG10_9HELI|nr:hypothetical protein NHP190012_03940 [Helicobacter sp. NHP19-012]
MLYTKPWIFLRSNDRPPFRNPDGLTCKFLTLPESPSSLLLDKADDAKNTSLAPAQSTNGEWIMRFSDRGTLFKVSD